MSWRLIRVMTRISRLVALARRQDRVITGEDLRRLGCSRDAIAHLVRTERIWRVYRGVYALEGSLTPRGWARAAVARCGARSVASHLTAAFLGDYVDRPPRMPQVTIASDSGAKGPRMILVRRTSTLTRADVDTRRGFAVTAPARTIIDCARILEPAALKAVVRRAEHHGLDLRALDRPGIPKTLRDLLDRYVIGSGLTANELEARFYEICARIGIPRPEIQAWFPDRRRIDFVWHDQRLIAETDGRQVHDTFIAFTDDRARDRAHTLLGFDTLRFTWAEVEDGTPVEDDLLAYFSRR